MFKNTPTQIWLLDFLQRCKSYLLEKRLSFQQMVLEQLDIQMQKQSRPKSHVLYEN